MTNKPTIEEMITHLCADMSCGNLPCPKCAAIRAILADYEVSEKAWDIKQRQLEEAQAELGQIKDRLISLDHDFGALVYEHQRTEAELAQVKAERDALEDRHKTYLTERDVAIYAAEVIAHLEAVQADSSFINNEQVHNVNRVVEGKPYNAR